ncbi:hypothetical protein TG4357_01162 [Thalassovita gelatinovora]|uniref:Flavinylation-associated cytochrome domain-containing protein n=1 Tax=Thalassovita gelatinovora TaxID=53501 RepID=A0A0P1F8C7_THAGE|nr:DUF4405 domain-containing protein [Thalassovita gelatinovora]QIZ80324.1 DUF4405 domain-containing protein [Thalassovita gelatinovora]CUH64237.1 hypothetical protein TG4357_01162 [Thalassovita gelatinovora]SEQ94591.1 protein of unknown function [Thalassovita gelatinovora]
MASLRNFATPLTIGAFTISGVTGVLMFFHLDTGLNKVAHEWLSWALLAGVGLHLAVNFRAFKTYFKRPKAMAIIGAGALLLAASFLPLGGGGNASPVAAVMQGMGRAPVEKVIALTGETAESGLMRLNAAGIQAAPGQTIGALSGGDRGKQAEILQVIFAADPA